MSITYAEYLAIQARAAERGEIVGCIEASVTGMPITGLDRLAALLIPGLFADAHPGRYAEREAGLELDL